MRVLVIPASSGHGFRLVSLQALLRHCLLVTLSERDYGCFHLTDEKKIKAQEGARLVQTLTARTWQVQT